VECAGAWPLLSGVGRGAGLFHSGVCVFIIAGPSTKLFTWGGGIWEDMCYERQRAEACVD
jgi:hypothetical protein